MNFYDYNEARAKEREFTVFKLFQALSLACKNANAARDQADIADCVRKADNIRTRLVNMGELPETSR